MRRALPLVLLALAARAEVLLRQGGDYVGPVTTVSCGTNMTCSRAGSVGTISSSGGPGGSGAPVDGGYVVLSGHSSGSTNERTLSAGQYTAIDTATASQVQVDWVHGLTCSAGQALTSSGTTALACTSTLTASDVACAGTCVADGEIAGVSGAKVSGPVAEATAASTAGALAGDPADCTAGQYAHTIAASGALTCAQVATSQLSGTVGIAQGGTTETASAEDAVLVGAGTTDWAPKVLPNCSAAQKLAYDTATNAFSCATDLTGAGSAWTSYEFNFGTIASRAECVTVTDAAVSGTSNIVIQHVGIAATGRQQDEAEMDGLVCRGLPAAGSFKLCCTSLEGATHGLHSLRYQVN